MNHLHIINRHHLFPFRTFMSCQPLSYRHNTPPFQTTLIVLSLVSPHGMHSTCHYFVHVTMGKRTLLFIGTNCKFNCKRRTQNNGHLSCCNNTSLISVLTCLHLYIFFFVQPIFYFFIRTCLRATSHTSQEPWPWNCESPKESVQRQFQVTPKIM